MGKVAGDLGERGDKEIAKVVAPEPVAGAEAVGKEFGQQILFGTERNHAVTQVSRGQHVEVFSEPARGAAIVCYGDDRSKIRDLQRDGSSPIRKAYMTPEPAQQRRETGAAADGYNAQGRRVCGRSGQLRGARI